MLKISAVLKDTLNGVIHLPTSKSISHRFLIIQAMSQVGEIQLDHISNSHDTILLQQALKSNQASIDFEDAGTPMRFYLAFAALKDKEVLITGNGVLKTRPIAPLVNALGQLGCRIKYSEQSGFLPIQIEKGVELSSNKVEIDSALSSQFLSALLLIAPAFTNGLEIITTSEISSAPYVALTLDAMQQCGIEVAHNNGVFKVKPGQFKTKLPIRIEGDWSAACFVFAWAALRPSKFELPDLNLNSKQGDKEAILFFKQLGVESTQFADKVVVQSNPVLFPDSIFFDFTNTPDMFPVVTATCAFLKIKASFTGVKNLTIKESNRILAMQNNLRQTGAQLTIINENELFMDFDVSYTKEYHFKSYNDHRIAMACSLFAFDKSITIDNEMVVNKSFPNYWEQFRSVTCD
ncbi:MAG: hypothetical protein PSX81_11965 [bacterium]|nr:hypothetical protein [bacterium]